ncbi:MAG: GFA family protein [Gammaproteobacteria bacterium]|nr:GFA family protein [Gammaproteobacteria bacterium]MDH5799793.1 GFA family protein [Gammaproteobacteria bacterium]
MSLLTGSCACGAVNYQSGSDVLNVVNCHCKVCKSHSGAAFTTYVVTKLNGLEITQGQELIRHYCVDSANKHFCGTCGTPLYNTNDHYPGLCMIYLGTLVARQEISPQVNFWCESQFAWVNELAELLSLPQGISGK